MVWGYDECGWEGMVDKTSTPTKIAAIIGVITVIGGVLSQVANIGESVDKLIKLLLGKSISISMRDVRSKRVMVLSSDVIDIDIEMVVANKGDKTANNCSGELSFSTKVGEFHRGNWSANVNGKPTLPVYFEGGNTEKLVEFDFMIRKRDFQKNGYIRVLCDNVVTESVAVRLLEPS
jgi:hypothetical protein